MTDATDRGEDEIRAATGVGAFDGVVRDRHGSG
jgi:hypothetical protein